MIAVVAGGTGLTGRAVVRRLLADAEIARVVSVSRRPLGFADAKLTEVLIGDLAELPAVASQLAGQLYFCCLGTTMRAAGSRAEFARVDHGAVVAFGAVARVHEAHSFTVVSAMGAYADSRFFYNRVKGRAEDDLVKLGLRSLLVFRPALLVGERAEHRPSESLLMKTLVPLTRLLPARLRRRLVTPVETLAERMVAEGKAAPEGVRVLRAVQI